LVELLLPYSRSVQLEIASDNGTWRGKGDEKVEFSVLRTDFRGRG
jgi:hypothetical protein